MSENKKRNNYNKQALKGGETGSRMHSSSPKDELRFQPLEVKVYGNFDKALKAFRALIQKERTLSLYKEKQSYEKPSDKRRRKRKAMNRKREEMSYIRLPRKNNKSPKNDSTTTKTTDSVD